MAPNSDILGITLYDARGDFNNLTQDQIIVAYASVEAMRMAMVKSDALAIIQHFKSYAKVPALGLIAPGGAGVPVTGKAKIE